MSRDEYVRSHTWRCALLLCVCLGATVCRAGDEGFFILGKREGFVEFGAEAASLNSSLAGVNDFATTQRRLAERVGLRGDMALLDPSLLNVNYGLTFNFFQDHAASGETDSAGNGRLFSYNLESALLANKPISLNLFATRTNTTSLRDFAGTSEITNSNKGVALHLKTLLIPSTISYRHETLDESSRFGDLVGRRDEARNVLTYDGHNHWTSQDVALHYERSDIEDQVTPELSYTSHTAGATHRYQFGEELPRSLTFNTNYNRRVDNRQLASSALTLSEELGIQHTKSLATAYHYILSRFEGFGSDTTVHTGSLSVQHRLYESLTSELALQATRSALTSGSQDLYGGRFNSDYRKKLSTKSVLLANLIVRYDRESDRIEGRTVPVFQEKHIAHVGIPFRLSQPRVFPSSITVVGPSGNVFAEGIDYLTRLIGDFIELEPLLGGRIQEGDTLAVDYEVAAPPTFKFSTLSGAFTVGPDFGWFYPYYTFERNRQRLLAGVDSGFLEDLHANTVGARFRWTRDKVSVLLLNEYRSQHSRLLPYSSLQFSQSVVFNPRQSVSVTFNLDEGNAHYLLPERSTNSGLGRMTVSYAPLDTFTLDTFYSIRLWRDTLAVNENFQQGGARVRWAVSKFTASLSFDRDVRLRASTESHEFRIFANVVRRF